MAGIISYPVIFISCQSYVLIFPQLGGGSGRRRRRRRRRRKKKKKKKWIVATLFLQSLTDNKWTSEQINTFTFQRDDRFDAMVWCER